jgi:hypothetical protein
MLLSFGNLPPDPPVQKHELTLPAHARIGIGRKAESGTAANGIVNLKCGF